MLWKGFQRPKRLECNMETLSPTFGTFYAQPFERGFGTTIGNALRRVLLSSVEGAAVTAVKIDGVLHEFSSLPGVVEDTTDIILNLKQIPMKLNVDRPETIRIKADGPRDVRSGDIETSSNVEILDPDIHIASLSEEGKLHMEMRVKPGRGYVTADRNFDTDLDIGYIPIDSVHSPVRKVNYTVEDARLGQTTDYDKLTIEVWTNGSVLPQDAVALASKLISRSSSTSRRALRPRTTRSTTRTSGSQKVFPGAWTSWSCRSAPTTASRTRISGPSESSCRRPRPRCSRPRTSAASPSTRSRRSCRAWGCRSG